MSWKHMSWYFTAALWAGMLSFPLALHAADLLPKEQRYPVVNDAASIRAAYGSDAAAIRMVSASVEGKILSVELSAQSRPAFELLLAEEPRTTIWVFFPDKLVDMEDVQPGATIRARGWLLSSAEWAQASKSQLPRPNPALLLSACLVPMPAMNIIADRKWIETCTWWQNALIPAPWAGHQDQAEIR